MASTVTSIAEWASVSEVPAGPPDVPGRGQAFQGRILARDWSRRARQSHWLPQGKPRTPSGPWNGKCPGLRQAHSGRSRPGGPRPATCTRPSPSPEHISRSLAGNTGGCRVVAQAACVSVPISHEVKFLVGWENAPGPQACWPEREEAGQVLLFLEL